MKFIKSAIILIAVVCITGFIILALHLRTNGKVDMSYKSDSGFYLGTIIDVKIYGAPHPKKSDFDDVFNLIGELENKLSRNILSSDISKINQNSGRGPVEVSPETFYVTEMGLYYSTLSNGRFDITIGPLVDLWGIGTDTARVPEASEIEDVLQRIDYHSLFLDRNTSSLQLAAENMAVDLGGIAKGYVADQVSALLKEKGFNHAIINLGGNIYVLGSKPDGTTWRVGIQNPLESRGKYIGVVGISNLSVVTSGIYERYLEAGGKRYHHILDTETGFPVENNLAGVSILSEKSIDGDGLSTTAFAMGLKDGMDLIESLDNVEAVFVTRDKNIYLSSGIKDYFELSDNEYKIQNEY